MMMTILLSVALIGIFIAAMSVRAFFIKNGEFRGTCASQNPLLQKEGAECGYCGRKVSECPNK